MKSKPKYYVVDRTKKILSNKSLDELVETSKQMVKDIKNGIECYDTVRPFDLVDYYENTNL